MEKSDEQKREISELIGLAWYSERGNFCSKNVVFDACFIAITNESSYTKNVETRYLIYVILSNIGEHAGSGVPNSFKKAKTEKGSCKSNSRQRNGVRN